MKRFAWAAALVACVVTTAGCEFTVQSGGDPETPPTNPPANGTQPATPGGTDNAKPSLGQRIAANSMAKKVNLLDLLKGKDGGDGGDGGETTNPAEDGVGTVIVKVLNGTCDDFLVDGLTIGGTTGFESPITVGQHEFQCIPDGQDPQTQTADIEADTTTELTFDVADASNNKVVPVNVTPPEGRPTP